MATVLFGRTRSHFKWLANSHSIKSFLDIYILIHLSFPMCNLNKVIKYIFFSICSTMKNDIRNYILLEVSNKLVECVSIKRCIIFLVEYYLNLIWFPSLHYFQIFLVVHSALMIKRWRIKTSSECWKQWMWNILRNEF